jgi:hypothetical protein
MAAGVTVPVKNQEQAGWKLSVTKLDVAVSLDQLEDVVIVCHYSIKPM